MTNFVPSTVYVLTIKPSRDPYEVGFSNIPFAQVRTWRPERLVGPPRSVQVLNWDY